MDNFDFLLSFGWIPLFIFGFICFLLGMLLSGLFRKDHDGDLTVEGEGALRTENDGLRTRIHDLEAAISGRDTEVAALTSQLSATGAAAPAQEAASSEDDETYALEWRNRYLAARVKYLETRLAEKPVAAPAKKAVAAAPVAAAAAATLVAAKAPAKPKAKKAPAKPAKKATAKAAPAPQVLYTDGPTDGEPDDLKLIKGIGPKFEADLHGKGVYYFRQIANWKKKDVEVVEKVIDSIPGRIERDEWVPQAKGLAKSGGVKADKTRKKPGPKPGTKRGETNLDGTPRKKPGPKKGADSKASDGNDKYYENVKKFDANAKAGYVDNIVKYLGASLNSRDSSLVACSDPTEVNTVVMNLMVKKFELDKEKGEAIVKEVCTEMKSERFKNRVTFYYLCAKKARKLSFFS